MRGRRDFAALQGGPGGEASRRVGTGCADRKMHGEWRPLIAFAWKNPVGGEPVQATVIGSQGLDTTGDCSLSEPRTGRRQPLWADHSLKIYSQPPVSQGMTMTEIRNFFK